jgi:hypothetical protein
MWPARPPSAGPARAPRPPSPPPERAPADAAWARTAEGAGRAGAWDRQVGPAAGRRRGGGGARRDCPWLLRKR